MTGLEKLTDVAHTDIIVIPIIDVSGSMYGTKIGQVNEAMAEVPSQLADINDESVDSILRIAPMEFSSGARWFALKNDKPAEVESFRWIDMKASGLTDLGAAFKLLNEKLTVEEKGGWMKGRGGAAPILILISDGGPTDDYKSELEKLKKRGWFRSAVKFAVAVGADADKKVLAEFTGNIEAVIDTEMVRNELSSIVKTVIVSASKTVSEGVSASNGGQLIKEVTDDGPDADAQAQQDAIDAVKDTLSMDDTDALF